MQYQILHFYRCVFVIIMNQNQVLTVLLSLGGKFNTPVKVTGKDFASFWWGWTASLVKPNSPTGVDTACVCSTVVVFCFLSLFSSASQNIQLTSFQTNVLMKLKAQELNSLGRMRGAKEDGKSSRICLFSCNRLWLCLRRLINIA